MEANPATNCPSPETLTAFARSALTNEAAAGIVEHLETCAPCEATVASLEVNDTLLVELRRPVPIDADQVDSAYQAILPRLESIGQPSASPGVLNSSAPVPRQLGEYLVLDRLGSGGMGVVYRALHQRLKRPAAIKVLAPGRVENPEALARFEREMEAIGQLDHPHIVRALDAGESAGVHYLAMELVEGATLAALVDRLGPLSIADACESLRQAALGLAHAHDRGLVHRDVKPSNLIVTRDGTLKVLDLGLARLTSDDDSQELTRSGQTLGTLDYMSPEQAGGDAVDKRTDVYSLGCTLFKLLMGDAPFVGPEFHSPARKLRAHAERPFPSLASRQVPSALASLVDRMTAKNPADRPASLSEVASAIAPFAAGSNLAGAVARYETAPAKNSRDSTGLPPTEPSPAVEVVGRSARTLPVHSVVGWGLAAGFVVVAATIIIQITLPDGQKLTVQAPDNSKVEILAAKDSRKTERRTDESPAVGQAGGSPGVTPQGWKPGLVMELFPRHRKQDGREGALVPLEQLGKQIGERTTIQRLDHWRHPEDLDAKVSGFLKVDEPGVYEFDSVSHYARSVLYVNDQEICSYRDLQRVGKVKLAPGWVRFASVSYVNGRGEVYVRWKPPGQKDLRPIPQDRLFHDPASFAAIDPEAVATKVDPPLAPAGLGELKPGLWGVTYQRQATQKVGNGGFVPPEKLVAPGEGFVVHNLCPWKYPPETNAMASGWLRIDVAGEYAFQCLSADDRNTLYLNDHEVCGYNDGEFAVSRVKLPRGWISIALIGFIDGKEQLELRWQPPGQRIFTPIPQTLLGHTATPPAPDKR